MGKTKHRLRLAVRLAVQAIVVLMATVVCAAAQDREPGEINPIKWSLKPVSPSKPVEPGEKFTLQLTAEIEDGWHLYSTEEMPQGPKPTRIVLIPDQPFNLSDIDYPMPQKAIDPNFGAETEFYERSVTFGLAIEVKKDAKPGSSRITVQIRYQSCTETLCLLPRLVKLDTEIQIAGR